MEWRRRVRRTRGEGSVKSDVGPRSEGVVDSAIPGDLGTSELPARVVTHPAALPADHTPRRNSGYQQLSVALENRTRRGPVQGPFYFCPSKLSLPSWVLTRQIQIQIGSIIRREGIYEAHENGRVCFQRGATGRSAHRI